MEGALKAEIGRSPEKLRGSRSGSPPRAPRPQARAQKKLVLITNSEWFYTRAMMDYSFDRLLGGHALALALRPRDRGGTQARVLLRAHARVRGDRRRGTPLARQRDASSSASATSEERAPRREEPGPAGEDILYVGDHIFADVNVSKS
jgi:5'-nucleotidase